MNLRESKKGFMCRVRGEKKRRMVFYSYIFNLKNHFQKMFVFLSLQMRLDDRVPWACFNPICDSPVDSFHD